MEVKKVLERKDGIKIVIIPKNSPIKKGDYVKITKIEENGSTRERKENEVFLSGNSYTDRNICEE